MGMVDELMYITEKEQRWLALLICLDALLWYALKYVPEAKGKELSLAYPLASFVATLQFVKHGYGALFDGTMMTLSNDAYSRLKSPKFEGFADLAQITFAYEVFNSLSSIIMPQYRTGEFLGHHIVTMIIAKCSQRNGPEFYGLFFLGIASVSTLPLVFVDMFRHGPKTLAQTYPAINNVARISFAITFLVVRAFCWPLVSLVFWHDAIINLMDPPEDGGTWRPYLIGLLLSNTFLGVLQVSWARRIWKSLVKGFRSNDKKTKSS